MTIRAQRASTSIPIATIVNRGGGIPGQTVAIRIFPGNDQSLWLDFPAPYGAGDGVFKGAAHASPTLDLTEPNAAEAPGVYSVAAGFSLAGVTVPAAADFLLVRFTITAGGELGDDLQTIQFEDDLAALVADVTRLRDWRESRREIDFAVTPRVARLYDRATGLVQIAAQELTTEGGEPVATAAGVQTKRGTAT